MSGRKSIKKNYFYNLTYQIFLIIVPIFVTPYVSRVLGVNGVGRYSYSYSIVSYFTLFAALGFNNYAQRLVASHQGDRQKQSEDFWSVFIARLIPVTITLVTYYILLITNIYGEKYNTLMLILSLDVIAVAFNVVFFFQGNEEFAKIVLRNIIIKCISIVCIFTLVRTSDDLILYVAIQGVTTLLSNLSLWLYLPRYLVPVRLGDLHPLTHMGPTLVLFLPTIATSVYTSLDKTMIGIITGSESENGNYEYAEKIVKICMTVITSLGTVMIPRNSQQFARGDMAAVERNVSKSCRFVFFLGIPMTLGMMLTAGNLIPWYLGPGYDKAAGLMMLLAPIVIIIGFSNVFGMQFLIPCHMDRRYSVAIISGAVSNFCMNLVLIAKFGAYGAAMATVAAETIVTLVMYIFIRDHLDVSGIIKASYQYLAAGIIMTLVVWPMSRAFSPSVLHTGIMAAVGAGVYFAVLILMKDDFMEMGRNLIFNVIKKAVKKHEE